YKIHISMLTKLSPDMGSILSIPDGKDATDPTREGTELFPLLLPGIEVQEFNDFLYWLYRFSIPEWVEPAVMAIFEGKLSDLTDMDLSCIGLKVYSILVRGMERMEIEIKRTANVEPPMVVDPDWQCQNHGACIAAWKRLWWDKIGRKLLHPDKPM
ncbi:hypothetical protein B0H10DRAFT_1685839, partial [Mycena sp. CBHHK59/15]